MRPSHACLAAFLLLPTVAAAQQGETYQHCVDLTKSDAQAAYYRALAWHSAGGGSSAEHCEALALVQLHRYADAAPLLDKLGQGGGLSSAERAQLFDQAGNMWLLAEQAPQAERSFGDALALTPRDVDTLADRARARAMRKDWSGAAGDLTAALAVDGNRADLLVLRASALHAGGDKKEARADIDRALAVYPGYGDALVERGAMKFEDGDAAGARADWQAVAKAQPSSRAAALAGEYLTETDSK